eukprot:CAMPEP_0170122592 /NCGR_PEP_ID=MMETSP0020_2-20130122/16822_1 /TAXON_ID=98059 /ORGANISM="Dinobryon sp., Strain UTEXLB2267" /LENGTH=46 /DNA_ID= /DNA_START= /DNA_END= /DNA_ORIENTATION=
MTCHLSNGAIPTPKSKAALSEELAGVKIVNIVFLNDMKSQSDRSTK